MNLSVDDFSDQQQHSIDLNGSIAENSGCEEVALVESCPPAEDLLNKQSSNDRSTPPPVFSPLVERDISAGAEDSGSLFPELLDITDEQNKPTDDADPETPFLGSFSSQHRGDKKQQTSSLQTVSNGRPKNSARKSELNSSTELKFPSEKLRAMFEKQVELIINDSGGLSRVDSIPNYISYIQKYQNNVEALTLLLQILLNSRPLIDQKFVEHNGVTGLKSCIDLYSHPDNLTHRLKRQTLVLLLKTIKKLPISLEVLVSCKVGINIKKLKDISSNSELSSIAEELFQRFLQLAKETQKTKDSGSEKPGPRSTLLPKKRKSTETSEDTESTAGKKTGKAMINDDDDDDNSSDEAEQESQRGPIDLALKSSPGFYCSPSKKRLLDQPVRSTRPSTITIEEVEAKVEERGGEEKEKEESSPSKGEPSSPKPKEPSLPGNEFPSPPLTKRNASSRSPSSTVTSRSSLSKDKRSRNGDSPATSRKHSRPSAVSSPWRPLIPIDRPNVPVSPLCSTEASAFGATTSSFQFLSRSSASSSSISSSSPREPLEPALSPLQDSLIRAIPLRTTNFPPDQLPQNRVEPQVAQFELPQAAPLGFNREAINNQLVQLLLSNPQLSQLVLSIPAVLPLLQSQDLVSLSMSYPALLSALLSGTGSSTMPFLQPPVSVSPGSLVDPPLTPPPNRKTAPNPFLSHF